MKTGILTTWTSNRIDAAGIASGVVLAGLFYFLAIQPMVTLRDRLDTQQKQLDDKRKLVDTMAARSRQLDEQLASSKSSLAATCVRLELAGTVNARIGRLNEMASGAGLTVREIQPADAVYGPNYGSVSIHLGGSGNYRSLVAFAHQVTKSLQDMSVESFQLAGKPDAPSSPMDFSVNLIWYVAPPQGPAISSATH